jgi:hypothetical protein
LLKKNSQMQVTTVVLFRLQGNFNKFWGFGQVPLASICLKNISGLQFFKSMGSGSGAGFGSWPDFGQYTWLMVWESSSHAESFFRDNIYLSEYVNRCLSTRVLYLKNIVSHGQWSGINPFVVSENPIENAKIAVLTRARIRTRKVWQFWRQVGKTSDALYQFDELEYAVGIGELPLIYQATISVWSSIDSVNRYAYQHEAHKKVIQLARKNNWYSEELFARFYLEKEIYLCDSFNE